MANLVRDPKAKITEALTDPENLTDMLSIFVNKDQKRFDAHLEMGAGVYRIPHYLDFLKTDRRQQMAMKARGTTPRSEQLKEAMMASKDNLTTDSGIQPVADYMRRDKDNRGRS